MFKKNYQDELSYLREMGREFAKANPDAAHFLSEHSKDPDVERLLEGFAFLTSSIRQKLDDELPELIHSLMTMLFPNYLRPVPSMSILEFHPIPHALIGCQTISRGTEVESEKVDGIACKFQTCYDVDVLPLTITDVDFQAKTLETPPFLKISLKLTGDTGLDKANLTNIRFFIHGEQRESYTLYLWLSKYVKELYVRSEDSDHSFILQPGSIRFAGFHDEEAVLPYPKNSFPGYRLLQEYYALPEKFLFFNITNLDPLSSFVNESSFDIIINFTRSLDDSIMISRENILLNCTPVLNIFKNEADPIRVENDKTEYMVRPAGENPLHYEIFSIDNVNGWAQTTSERHEFSQFFSFHHEIDTAEGKNVFYRSRLQPSVIDDGFDTYISFVNNRAETAKPPVETISLELTCTNRRMADKLKVGEITVPTSSSPEYAKFRNITKVTNSVIPPLGGDLHWRLISHLSINYRSFIDVEALKTILGLYNFHAIYDRQAARTNELLLNGIKTVTAKPDERLFKGSPVRGISIEVEIDEDNFGSEGNMYLFISILNEFFSLCATVNSFCRMSAKGLKFGERYSWPPKRGNQILI